MNRIGHFYIYCTDAEFVNVCNYLQPLLAGILPMKAVHVKCDHMALFLCSFGFAKRLL
jgi:hypothetical protein